MRRKVSQTGIWVFGFVRGSLLGDVTDLLRNLMTGAGKVIGFF